MSVAGVVAAGRAAAIARMTDTCTVRRNTGQTTQDETTGLETPVWRDVHTDLACRISGTAANSAPYKTRDYAQGVQITEGARVANFPWNTTDLADGDLLEVTAGDLTGLVFQIIEADFQDQATARRVPVVAVVRPEEWP